jgi:hypothetical protein
MDHARIPRTVLRKRPGEERPIRFIVGYRARVDPVEQILRATASGRHRQNCRSWGGQISTRHRPDGVPDLGARTAQERLAPTGASTSRHATLPRDGRPCLADKPPNNFRSGLHPRPSNATTSTRAATRWTAASARTSSCSIGQNPPMTSRPRGVLQAVSRDDAALAPRLVRCSMIRGDRTDLKTGALIRALRPPPEESSVRFHETGSRRTTASSEQAPADHRDALGKWQATKAN